MSKATKFVLILLFVACGILQAQTGNGSIQGTVKDASGGGRARRGSYHNPDRDLREV